MKVRHYLYRAFDAKGALIYVGVSLSVLQRLSQHRITAGWFGEVDTIKIERFASKGEAEAAEREAIAVDRPKYNIQHQGRAPPRRSRETVLSLDQLRAEQAECGRGTAFVNRHQLASVLSIRPSQLRDAMREEGFPSPLRIGPDRASYWRRADLLEWAHSRCGKAGHVPAPPDP